MSETDTVALVTGAGSGIGRSIALALAAQGMVLWLVGRNKMKLDAVAEEAHKTCPAAHCVYADLGKAEDIAGLAACIKCDVGYLDILVNCAGYISLGPLASADVSELDRHYHINVRAPYLLTQLLLPALQSRQGQVVFVNSSAGCVASANSSQYAASKHALRAIADSLHQEVNPYGMRVLSIYPGRTASSMQAAVHAMEGRDYEPARLMQPEDVAAVVINALTLPRSAEVTDVHIRSLHKL